jgi:hypothetical protein
MRVVERRGLCFCSQKKTLALRPCRLPAIRKFPLILAWPSPWENKKGAELAMPEIAHCHLHAPQER